VFLLLESTTGREFRVTERREEKRTVLAGGSGSASSG
jgi:hypothetical protein